MKWLFAYGVILKDDILYLLGILNSNSNSIQMFFITYILDLPVRRKVSSMKSGSYIKKSMAIFKLAQHHKPDSFQDHATAGVCNNAPNKC